MYAESRLIPGSQSPIDSGNGICQWTNYRNPAFAEWYKRVKGKDVKKPKYIDMDEQLEYVKYEMENTHRKFLDTIRKCSDPQEAADLMLRGFENGDNNTIDTIPKMNETYHGQYEKMLRDRQKYALNAYKVISTLSPQFELAQVDPSLLKGTTKSSGDAEIGDQPSGKSYNDSGTQTNGTDGTNKSQDNDESVGSFINNTFLAGIQNLMSDPVMQKFNSLTASTSSVNATPVTAKTESAPKETATASTESSGKSNNTINAPSYKGGDTNTTVNNNTYISTNNAKSTEVV
jgi:hypothetical protein